MLTASETAELVSDLNGLPAVKPTDVVTKCDGPADSQFLVIFSGGQKVHIGMPTGCRSVTNGDVSQMFIGSAKEPGEKIIDKLTKYLGSK